MPSLTLSGGEPAALTLLDAVVRILPGVMGNQLSGVHESFEGGLLEQTQIVPMLVALVVGVGFGNVLAGVYLGDAEGAEH